MVCDAVYLDISRRHSHNATGNPFLFDFSPLISRLRQYQSGLAIGIFSGVVLVMSSQMLIVFALFVDRIQNGHDGNNKPVEKAMAVLAFLLFVAYGLFGVLLIIFRKDIVKEGRYHLFASLNPLNFRRYSYCRWEGRQRL